MQKNQWSIVILLLLITSTVFIVRRVQRSKRPALPTLLIIGTTADYPPFSFKKAGEIQGFDIEIAKAIAEKLAVEYEIRDLPFSLLLPNLQEGKIHIAAAGLSAEPSRRHQALFTKPYVTQDPLIILTLQESAIAKAEDLRNKRLTVNTGYTADIYATELPNVTIQRTQTLAQSVELLQANEVDAFITNLNTLKPIFDLYGAEKFRAVTIPDTDENIALGLSPLYPELTARIQGILDQFMRDGTIDKLRQKWHIQ